MDLGFRVLGNRDLRFRGEFRVIRVQGFGGLGFRVYCKRIYTRNA